MGHDQRSVSVRSDKQYTGEIAAKLRIHGDPVELLHLLTQAEYALEKDEGVNAILDLFDAKTYPFVLDPARRSMV